jgi:hypothetical protein
LTLAIALTLVGRGTVASGNVASIKAQDLKEWLSYVASDELEGRATFSTGIGLAAAYLQDHLRAWGVKPAGDGGSYLQTVRVLSVRTTNRSSVTVELPGQSRTFAEGQGVTFGRNVGTKRRFTIDRVEFSGYGLDAPRASHVDYAGRDVAGAAVIWLGAAGPKGIDSPAYQRVLNGRNGYALNQLRAAASIGPQNDNPPPTDFTTTQRLDVALPPAVTASDAFLDFLFSHGPIKYDDLKAKAAAQEPLPSFHLDGVRLTFNIDADYQIVRTQFAQNVVGIVEGADAQLKSTSVRQAA